MGTIILTCKNLRYHPDAAQCKMGTDYEVVDLDTALHVEPEKMRLELPEEIGKVSFGKMGRAVFNP